MAINHAFQSGRGDNGDAGAIQPSQWNADHQLDGMLAALDTAAPAPNTVFSFDGSANFLLLPYASFAPVNSPNFIGIPLAPTAAAGTNNYQIATTGFVSTAIANLVSSAPTTLETLNEIASALGDDPNFSATMTASLGYRLRVDAAQGLTSGQQSQGRSNLGLGTAALATVGTAAGDVVALDGSARLPAVDGSQLTNLPKATGAVVIIKVHYYTASGTYTPDAKCLFAVIRGRGGGGGGGGGPATATGIGSGGGGGAGGLSQTTATIATLGAGPFTVTVGAGGNGGSTGTTAGSAGGDTSVGTLMIAKGAGGGASNTAGVGANGGAGGVAGTAADFTLPGNGGGAGFGTSLANITGTCGQGAQGDGGQPAQAAALSAFINGASAAANSGSGGNGGLSANNATGATGGNGAAGWVRIDEYCSS